MLELKNIKKSYTTGDFTQIALDDIDLKFRENEFVSILGASGSGKTTLLNIIGGLDRYDSGDLIINGKSTKNFKNKDWDAYRNNSIGFIFQSYNLIGHMNLINNVELCMTLSGVSASERRKRAKEALKKVGLLDHMHKKPNQLSGGQMQRVAIARALVNNPDIILADEPTGALDSKTSIQIMDLIKEIAKDKLVIMVTHNPELAKQYSTRIIELKDGKKISDSMPVAKNEKNNIEYKMKKTSMNFLTALKLSFNNILTKKGRTILTAFASSIGIIGIALILSLSNGFQIQIDKYEKDTLSQMPIVISKQSMTTDAEELNKISSDMMDNKDEYTSKKEIYPLKTITNLIHNNDINLEYENYIANIDPELISGISYNRTTNINILAKINGEIKPLSASKFLFPLPENIDGTSDIVNSNFDLIYGTYPSTKEELLLLVDTKNRVSEEILELLGFSDKEKITFDDILSLEFKVVLNDNFYKNIGEYFTFNTNYNEMFDNKDNLTLKITGIIRGKEDNEFARMSGNGLTYKNELMNYIIEKAKTSEIVSKQRYVNYNVLTGEQFDINSDDGKTMKETCLAYLGDEVGAMAIQVYPRDFDSKDDIITYLDNYNKGKSDEDKILYIDYADAITTLSGSIMDAITIVLIAFSAISLIVSSIMIGIIIYISVLERTREIGVLRALGARKKDITRVFNAETFIIGLTSGLLGILIARLLIFPINIIIHNLTDLENVAKLDIIHAVILILISVILTVIGGYIPAKIASKKDPVIALRTE